ncbi:MAG: hypothetical protein LR015_12720 [Verrucomicrobia bacterium]|nr:hypothetical protein [Verrucomicrobiota bacterium]
MSIARLLPLIAFPVCCGQLAATNLSPEELNLLLEAGQITTQTLVLSNSQAVPFDWRASVVQQSGTTAMMLAAGGDSFGYRWSDSNEAGGPEFRWFSRPEAVQEHRLGDDDSVAVDLPFNFVFYGDTYQQMRISSNGFLTFGPNGNAHNNAPIPSPATPNALIAVYWCDLDPTIGDSSIHSWSDPETQVFVVEYTNIQRLGGSTPMTFQAVLHANGNISMNYADTTGISNVSTAVTVGIENATGTVGSQVVHNTVFQPSGLTIEFRSPTWLSVMPSAGSLLPGASVALSVTANAGALNAGQYEGTIRLSSGSETRHEVPVRLEVTGQPKLQLAPSTLTFDVVGVGGTIERTLDLNNAGSAPLILTGAEINNNAFIWLEPCH